MRDRWRRFIRRFHPEGHNSFLAMIYNLVSGTELFQRHYDLVAGEIARCCRGGRLLDIGTGPGWLLLSIRRVCPHLRLSGVDISPAVIEGAARNIERSGAGGIELAAASSEALPYPDGSMDCVVSTLSIHHWKDMGKGLMEIHRVLKPGGRALIYDLVQKLPEEITFRNNREFGRFKMILLKLHSFEEPFYSVKEIESLADAVPLVKEDVHFTGALCCLSLKKG